MMKRVFYEGRHLHSQKNCIDFTAGLYSRYGHVVLSFRRVAMMDTDLISKASR